MAFRVKKRPSGLQSFMAGMGAGVKQAAPKMMEMMMKTGEAEKEKRKELYNRLKTFMPQVQTPSAKADLTKLMAEVAGGVSGEAEVMAYMSGITEADFTKPEKPLTAKQMLEESKARRERVESIKDELTPEGYTEPERPVGRMAGATEVSEEQWNQMVDSMVGERKAERLRGELQSSKTAKDLTPVELQTLGLTDPPQNQKWVVDGSGKISLKTTVEKPEKLSEVDRRKLMMAEKEYRRLGEEATGLTKSDAEKAAIRERQSGWAKILMDLGGYTPEELKLLVEEQSLDFTKFQTDTSNASTAVKPKIPNF